MRTEYTEIRNLAFMLWNEEIPFETRFIMNGMQVIYPNNNLEERICDAIEHDGSYGRTEDKLELMGLLTSEERKNDSVVGNLSAQEVFDRIKKHFESEGKEWENTI